MPCILFMRSAAPNFSRTQADDFEYVPHLAAVVGGRLTTGHTPLAVAVADLPGCRGDHACQG